MNIAAFIKVLMVAVSCREILCQESVDLGTFTLGIPDTWLEFDLPYYKPHGIVHIPTFYVNSLIIHRLTVDNKIISPNVMNMASIEAATRLTVTGAPIEEECRTIRVRWNWAWPHFTRESIKKGVSINMATGKSPYIPERYIIPYGTERIEMLYSIRFMIIDNNKLLETYDAEEMYCVRWKLVWHLPE